MIFPLVVPCSSSRFSRVEPQRTHASLWTNICSCSAMLLRKVRKFRTFNREQGRSRFSSRFGVVRCVSTLTNLLEQHSTTRASIRPQVRMSSVWFDPSYSVLTASEDSAVDSNFLAQTIGDPTKVQLKRMYIEPLFDEAVKRFKTKSLQLILSAFQHDMITNLTTLITGNQEMKLK